MSKILKLSANILKRKRFGLIQKSSKYFISQVIDKKPYNISFNKIIRNVRISNFTLPNMFVYWSKYAKLLENLSLKVAPLRINHNVPISLGNHQNNGASNVIFSVRNYDFANKVVVKQPFKLCDEVGIASSAMVESDIYKKIGSHINITRYVRDIVCDLSDNNELYRTDFPDVCYSGKIKSILLEKMDYNLKDLLKNCGGEFTEKDRCDIVAQVCEAEHHLFCRNIAHRDLKMDNILVNVNSKARQYLQNAPKFIVKLCDFDCAIDVSNRNKEDTVSMSGAPVCQPPEIMTQHDKNNIKRHSYERADFWAIGCLIYELFENANPFTCDKKLSVTQEYTNSQLPMISSAPIVINKVAHNLLSYEPSKRYMASICADLINVYTLSSVISRKIISDFEALFLSSQMCQMYWTSIRLANNSARRSFIMDFVRESQLEDVE